MTWATFELANKPQIQEKLRKEIMSTRNADNRLEYNTIEGLKYLNNFVREVLRVYPPSMPPRHSLTDFKITLLTKNLPA